MTRDPRTGRRMPNHQRSWLWGRHAVVDTLTAGKWPVTELFADAYLDQASLSQLNTLAAQCEVAVQLVPSQRLKTLCQADDHQGYLARLGTFPTASEIELHQALTSASDLRERPPLYVICDRIQDAHNFGAILRTCDAMAVDGVIVGVKEQCRVTPHVVRSSAGAVNHLTIFEVPSLQDSVLQLKSFGMQMVAASEKASASLWTTPLHGPVAILIGTEATGIDPTLLSLADVKLQIPMLGRGTSLNAAVAAGILLAEIRRQQNPGM